MLDGVFEKATSGACNTVRRDDGPAFIRAACSLYGLKRLDYVSLNVPFSREGNDLLRHNFHSASKVCHKVGKERAPASFLEDLPEGSGPYVVEQPENTSGNAGHCEEEEAEAGHVVVTAPITTRRGETAVFAIAPSNEHLNYRRLKDLVAEDLRILMTYYHGHMLRLSGLDSHSDIIISARELDCLKWTAEGKTAWEASCILGISERTVRFHLNSAREKMCCSTTAQAVAKAVAQHLITI